MVKSPSVFSLPEISKKRIEALVRSGYYTSKSDVVKDALRVLFETNPHLRAAIAMEMLKEKNVSLGRASEIAGISVEEFKQVLAERGIIRKIKVSRKEMKMADQLIKKMR